MPNLTTPFDSPASLVAIPRVEAVALSPDGERAVVTVATLSPDRTRWVRALWQVAADGSGEPVRLTRSAAGEGGVAFTPGGDILFVSARPDADRPSDGDEDDAAQLWRLPAGGGEARAVTRLAGGVSEIAATALESTRVVLSAELLHSVGSLEEDAARRARRRTRKVDAILHESYPVRFWDRDLGPGEPHLLALDVGELSDDLPDPLDAARQEQSQDPAAAEPDTVYPSALPRPVDLTPHPGRTADIAGAALTPDGATLIASIQVPISRAGRAALASIDVRSGARRMLFDEPGVQFEEPAIDHAGRTLAFVRRTDETPAGPTPREIWVAGIDGSDPHAVAPDWDRYPSEMCFSAEDDALIVVADDDGRAPVFRLPLDGGPVRRVTDDDGVYSHVSVDRATGNLVALRSSIGSSPQPVRIAPDGTVTPLPSPAPMPASPGRVEEIEKTASDGTRIRAWLVLPAGASPSAPAPLLLWIHGGPVSSWNSWSWRWNPLVMAAEGYAVLLPDPGLSTGYGLEFVARGWDAWGQEPFRDLMAITDAAEARDDIDASRTAACGGSFGGYMANWIATHTDRFKAIVSHASLWTLGPFQGTTDRGDLWEQIFSPEGARENSPDRFADEIRTPMLVIHGNRDYRVPIDEGIRLWSALTSGAQPDGSTDHKFLYFPAEHHWIETPQHAVVWYETVLAFLARHVLGQEWRRPDLLG